MAEKKKLSIKKTYIATAIFAFTWFIVAGFGGAARRLDYSWQHLVLNTPAVMNLISANLGFGEFVGNRYSFGKHITKPANPKISIAAVDDFTLEEYGWPVPRSYYGDLVRQLKKYGAKAIVFDVIMTQSKRTKVDEDRRFVEACAKAGNVVNLIVVDPHTNQLNYPLKGLAAASAIIAEPHMDGYIDSDGQIRRYMPFWKEDISETEDGDIVVNYRTYGETDLGDNIVAKEFPELPIPSIGAAALSLYTGKHLTQIYLEFYDQIEPEKVLNYRDFVRRAKNPGWSEAKEFVSSSFRHISFADILSGRLSDAEKEAIRDGIVLVGSTALGAFDHSPSPFHYQLPGVEIHATFIDNAIAGDFLETSGGFILLMLLLPWLPVLLRKYSLALLVSVCLSALFLLAVSYVILLANGVLVPFVSAALSLFLPFAYITVDKGLTEGREKKWIKNTFGQYLSPKVVELITKDPSKLSLGGEKRDMTAFFLDLAGFTTMSEKLTPEELTAMLVEYLSAFTDVILKYDGTVDKYIGDCVVAFWNAPLDQADHRRLGVLAAIDCQKELERLNESLTQFEIKPKCRVGVNSGPMVVGNMGSRSRLSYTVMGDSVNMASRMEGANKFFGSKIMTSEYTFEDIKDQFDYRYLGSIRVVGKVIPVKVYEPFALKGKASPEVREMMKHYEAGLDKFYKGEYPASVADFKAALAARPGDGPSQYYIDTAEEYAKTPPKDWDQSFTLTSKG